MCIWQQRSAPFYRRLKSEGGGGAKIISKGISIADENYRPYSWQRKEGYRA